MKKNLRDMRPVYVVGIGLHRYQRLSETPYVTLGLTAVREALADAALQWRSVESAYTGTVLIGMAASRPMLRHLGATGIPMAQVENASASGATAFRQACIDVASGLTDVSIAVGVDKPGPISMAPGKTTDARPGRLSAGAFHPFRAARSRVHDPQQCERGSDWHGRGQEQSQRGKQSLRPAPKGKNPGGSDGRAGYFGVADAPSMLPHREGAAAVIVASDDAIARLGIDRKRAVRVIASVTKTEQIYRGAKNFDAELTRETVEQAYREAAVDPATSVCWNSTMRSRSKSCCMWRRWGCARPARPPPPSRQATSI